MPIDVFADLSGAIVSGGTAQVIAAADASRKVFWIQNTSDTLMRVKLGGTASASAGFRVEAGALLTLTLGDVGATVQQAISVFCVTTGKTYEAGRS